MLKWPSSSTRAPLLDDERDTLRVGPVGLKSAQALALRCRIVLERASGQINPARELFIGQTGHPRHRPGRTHQCCDCLYLRSALAAGMVIPDSADPTLATVRVVD